MSAGSGTSAQLPASLIRPRRSHAWRKAWLSRRPRFRTAATVCALADEVARRTRVDLDDAESLSTTSSWLADVVADPYATGRARRAAGHVDALRGRYRAALAHYSAACRVFRRAGAAVDEAVTRSGALQTLIYLGRYTQAFRWADAARATFVATADSLRLARLESNVGNILHRQDRFDEALTLYGRALHTFDALGQGVDQAIVLRNIAVCEIGLNRFEAAMEAYRRARACSLQHDLRGIVAEVDYNVAYLHYLRGDYQRAIVLYNEARERCRSVPDPYHLALCDLDHAELSLELNLIDEGHELALAAHDQFLALGLTYERAKAMANLAVAAHRGGGLAVADRLYARARVLFAREDNAAWTAFVDLHRAFVLVEQGRTTAAMALVRSAHRFFVRSAFTERTALAELLLARLDAAQGRRARARQRCETALLRLGRDASPALAFRLWHLRGRIDEHAGRATAALRGYERAHQQIERLREHLHGEHLRVAFLQDKLAVYESLVRLTLAGRRPSLDRAFAYMEQAKSRALVEHLPTLARGAAARATPESAEQREVRAALALRYRDLAERHRGGGQTNRGQITTLLREIRRLERAMSRRFETAAEAAGTATGLRPSTPVSLEELRGSLAAGTHLLEYYVADGTVYGWSVGARRLQVKALGALDALVPALRFLRFHWARQPWSTNGSTAATDWAVAAHLATCFEALVAPFGRDLAGVDHLVIVPHGPLHALPFHALETGDGCVFDRWTCSYAPSATTFVRTTQRRPSAQRGIVLLGNPDARAPRIADEIAMLARHLPGASVALGRAATRAYLGEHAGQARLVHLATHGRFRADNPLFSSLELADGALMLYDLYDMPFDADLVTLSGCATGLTAVVGGDEPYGLTRGLLRAGARAVVGALWDAHDASTAVFMETFYAALVAGTSRAAAIRQATASVRARYPHPYYWAPFVLVGDGRPLPGSLQRAYITQAPTAPLSAEDSITLTQQG